MRRTVIGVAITAALALGQLNANLTPSRIALSNGAFDYKGTEPIGPMGANRRVHFKGHWDTSTGRFVGFNQLTGGSSDSGKRYWRMEKVA